MYSIKIVDRIVWGLLCLLSLCSGCSKGGSPGYTPPDDTTVVIPPPGNDQLPVLKGKIVYHSYVEYGEQSKMYLYDFSKKQLSCLSCNWNIYDPMNAHFSPDGTKIVFMGQAVKGGKWDIYLWTIGSMQTPVNLTANDGSRDEDPKFSPDGESICFKQTIGQDIGNLANMDLTGKIVKKITSNTIESGMPYYLMNATSLVYARGAGANSDIYSVEVDGSNNQPVANENNLQEYYPIVADSNSYFYSRWYSTTNHNDQVYRGYFSGAPSVSMPFNSANANYSDAYPYNGEYVFVSSTRPGTVGAYDLYIASIKTGSIRSLSSYHQSINTSANELGLAWSGN